MGKPNLILFGRSSLFLLLCFSVFLPGAASAVTCLELMAGLVANEGLTTISDQLADINGHRERTVLVVGEKAGVHGGEILTVRRIGSQWGASATTTHNEYDPQGDPRWFIDVMGAKTAAFFGFRILDGETMEVPNFREFHGATNKLNQILVAKGIEPISVRFFESKDSENTKVSEYLKRFCEVFEIPLASDGNHFFHDMSFHSSAMFLPEEFAREAAHYYRFQRHFFEAMEIKFASDPEKLKAVKYYKFLFEFMGTIDIDLATGELGPDIVRNQRNLAAGKLKAGSHGSDVSHYFDTLGRITDYTHSYSPYSNFDTSLAALSGTGGEYYSKSLDSTYPKVIHPEKLQRSLGHLDPMVLRVALKTFAEGYVASHPGGLEPLASRTDSGAKLEAYCQAVTEKRKAIIGAVAELTK